MGEHLEEVIEAHGDYLLRVAYLYVKDLTTAEDIVQDVFIAYYKKQSQFKGDASLKTYLVKMTVNRCHDYLRSWKRKRLTLMDKIIGKSDSKTPEYLVLEAADLKRVTEALLQLPILYREVIILYYYQEINTVKIAEILNCPEATIRTRLQRARKLLHKQLASYEWEGWQHESFEG
ncbi:sigma-70 family RNA polymerase sigma factor [Viridibacillus sp. YIM B01967]|uniref:Sigma-70 family RNA polymerase sigma factor n=1 Tax=Viridibacillus soli TaxID=2798301 RepID=A0ABS1HBL8_9BACL|nr:sigma-70 family RNA polymerase sigma factor [Viridibacillus soli]MBK3496482.1 sigma-70 family RNA polymerase sigma factor [Viridibacillus soli]